MASGPIQPGFKPPASISIIQQRLRLVVFGTAKVGKTTLAGTFPRPLFLDFDRGLESLAVRSMGGLQWPPPDDLEPIGYKKLESLYWWVKDRLDQFDSIIIDSISVAQQNLIDEIVDTRRDPDKDTLLRLMVPEQGEYQGVQRQLARLLTDFRRFGKHMCVIAGVRERMGKRSPDVTPGLFPVVAHWASVMGELVIHPESGDRVLITRPTGDREAGSRFRSLVPMVSNPTFDIIWRKVAHEYQQAAAAATNGGVVAPEQKEAQ